MILGQRGTGKTTYLFRNLDSYEPFVVVDPVFDPKFQNADLYHLKSVDESLKFFKYGNPRRIYISPNLVTFDFFCGVALARGNITLIVDEADHYATSYYISPNFKKVINIGRHRNVNVVAICRRPNNLSPIIRGQATRFVLFQMGGEDAKKLQSYVGSEVADKIPKLQTKYANNVPVASEYITYDFKRRVYSKELLKYVNWDQTISELKEGADGSDTRQNKDVDRADSNIDSSK